MAGKTILYVLEAAPYVDQRTAEALDRLLVCAAFDQPTSVLVRGAAVGALLSQQIPSEGRSVGKMLNALPTYDVNALYADADDLASSGIDAATLTPPVTPIAKPEIAALIARHDLVLSDA
ncbi:MAG: DsrE family protein [Pseudomonadota bacterium]